MARSRGKRLIFFWIPLCRQDPEASRRRFEQTAEVSTQPRQHHTDIEKGSGKIDVRLGSVTLVVKTPILKLKLVY